LPVTYSVFFWRIDMSAFFKEFLFFSFAGIIFCALFACAQSAFADDPGVGTNQRCTGTATQASQCWANSATLCPSVGMTKPDGVTFDYCECI
jgi:hypothetical protein